MEGNKSIYATRHSLSNHTVKKSSSIIHRAMIYSGMEGNSHSLPLETIRALQCQRPRCSEDGCHDR